MFVDAVTSLASRPTRTGLTALGSVFGIAALVATLGIAGTAGNRIVSRFDSVSASEVVVEPARVGSQQQATVNLTWAPEARLLRLNGVQEAGAMAQIADPGGVRTVPQLNPRGLDEFKIDVYAVSPGLLNAVQSQIAQGVPIDRIHNQRGDAVAVLGPNAARRLGLSTLRQQPSIFIGGHQFVVIGLLDTDGVTRESALLDAVIVPERVAREKFEMAGPDKIVIETEQGAASVIADQAPQVLSPNDPDLLAARRGAEPTRVKDEIRQDLNGLFLLLGVVSLVVGAIGIANVTLVSVLERTGEIGLRSALGETRPGVAMQFLAEGAVLGLVAGICGTSLGVLLVVTVAALKQWVPVLDTWVLVAAPTIGVLVGVVSGAYPSWRAASIEPADALRGGT